MQRKLVSLSACLLVSFGARVAAQGPSGGAHPAIDIKDHPVTAEILKKPDPADWLMYSRTYDAQRFSPLAQIDRGNVGTLQRAWTKELPSGPVEAIPLVYRGVMYLLTPGGRDSGSRIKALAIYEDMIYYTAPAPAANEPSPVIALDASTGQVRWSVPITPENHTAGAIVVEGKVISGRTCNTERKNCYISALDAKTGKEAWRFYTVPAEGEPGDVGFARHLRSRAAAHLLGHCQSDAEHAR